jgi:hypothetical protein
MARCDFGRELQKENPMSRFDFLGAAVVTALFAVPTLAMAALQDPATPPAGGNAGMAGASYPAGPGINTTGVPVSADQLPPGQVRALEAGDNKIVTNGPVPDTPANRAKYGKPMSHGGQKTPPAGN